MMKPRQKELDYFRREDAQYYAYYRVPKLLFTHKYYKNLSTEAKILYGILLDRMQLSLRNNWFDEDGRVYIYCTIREIMERLGCGNQKAVSLLKELDADHGIGLVEKKRQGMGKPNALYIKNFASILSKDQGIFLCPEKCDNHTSGNVKITSLEMWNPHSNKTDMNKKEVSETDPSYQDSPGQSIAPQDMAAVMKNLVDYEILIHDFPEDKGMIDGLIDMAADILNMPDQAQIRISGVERPVPIVKSQMMKLKMFHIQYILGCMRDTTTKISNIKGYLLAALYNAPMTMDNYYRARVQHEMYGGSPVKEEDRHGVPP